MKTFVLLALLSVLVATVASEGALWGSRQPGDYLLDRKIYKKDSAWLQKVTMDITLNSPYRQITMINAIDQKGEGSATLKSGGVGSYNAVLHLKSGRGKSLNYLIEVYGR